jgi:hypothetical protein
MDRVPAGARRGRAFVRIPAQGPDQPGFQQIAGDRQGQESQGVDPGVDGAGDAKGASLGGPQEISVAEVVAIRRGKVPGSALLAAKTEREHAAGRGNLDPDRVERPVVRREGRPDHPDGQAAKRGECGEDERGFVSSEAAIEADQNTEQNSGKKSQRHGGNPADLYWRSIKFEGKALTIR